MKRKVMIDIDTERKDKPVLIAYPDGVNQEIDPVQDMAIICEALCTIIHAAHESDVKKDFESVRDCIKHLQNGFIDETYKASLVNVSKIEKFEFPELLDALDAAECGRGQLGNLSVTNQAMITAVTKAYNFIKQKLRVEEV